MPNCHGTHPKQPMSPECYVFAKSHHFTWSSVRNPAVSLVVFKVSKMVTRRETGHSYYIRVSFQFSF